MSSAGTLCAGDLVRAALRGDARAWDALLLLLRSAAFGAAYQILRNEADAEDISHDSMCIVMEKIGSLDDPDAVIGWTHTISTNRARNLFRRRRETAWTPEALDEVDGGKPVLTPEPGVARVFDRLPFEQRAAVLSRYAGQSSWPEVAAEQGVSRGTAQSRARLGLARVRADLGIEISREESEGAAEDK